MEQRTLADHLEAMVEYCAPALESVPWAVEPRRWTELVFCLLARLRPDDEAPEVRRAVITLDELGLTDFPRLAAPDPAEDDLIAVAAILRAHGFAREDADTGVRVLRAGAARLAQAHGSLVVYLGQVATRVIEEVGELFAGDDLDDATARMAAAFWVQNTMHLPYLQENTALHALRERFGATFDDLFAAADKIGLNVALIDDLATATAGDPDFETFLRERDAAGNGAARQP